MDTFQAVYDAVRSRVSSCNVGDVIREVALLDASHAIHQVQVAWQEAAWASASPSAIYRPSLSIDGNQWCSLYGANLQEGVAGFGDSPAAAMADFDRNWGKPLTTPTAARKEDGRG